MITNKEMVGMLRYLKSANLSGPVEDFQLEVWQDVFRRKMPQIRIEDVREAAAELAAKRTASKGDTWVTPGDVITEVKRIRAARMSVIGTNLNRPPSLDFETDRKWTDIVYQLVGDGQTQEQAEAAANQAIGYTPTPELTTGPPRPLAEMVAQLRNNTQLPKAE